MSFNSETWEWLKTAPLPVVLAITISLFGVVGGYSLNTDKKLEKHASEEKATVAVAAEQAKTAAEVAKKMDGKLDRLLEIVIKLQVEKEAEDKAKAKSAKKENK